MTNAPILTFAARSEWYGVRAGEVLEVAHLRHVRPVPRAPEVIAGLAEVHGRLVTLIDLDRLLAPGTPADAGAADGAGAPWTFGVVLAPPHDHLAILVRSQVDVASAPRDEERGERAETGGLLSARLPIGERLLNLIALPSLLERVEEAIRRGFNPRTDAAGEAD
jgi:chemotaxis signal transduction protein